MRKWCNCILIIGSFLILQGCFVSKPYKNPDLGELDIYRDFNQQDTSTIANIPWQQLFPDSLLRALIQEGLDSSLILDTAYENLEIAKSKYLQGRAQFLPTIDALANVNSAKLSNNSIAGKQFQSTESGDTRRNQYELLGSLSWETDIWGRIRSLSEAQKANLLKNEAAYRAVQTRIIAMIASNYYRLLALDAQLELAKNTVQTREKSLNTIQKLQRSGIESALAVKQQEAQIYTARILEVDLQQQITITEDSLSVLIGRSVGEISRGNLIDQNIEVEPEIGIPSQLLRNRPDVLAAEYNLTKSFYLTNEAKANFYPRLVLSAEAGYQSLDFSNWLNSASFYNMIMAGITAPIFRQREIRTNYEVAQANQRKALANYEQRLLNAGREVTDALRTYEATKEKLSLREEQVKTLTTAEEYSYKLLLNGYANYLEVLRATDEKLTAEMKMIDTQYLHLNSLVSLYRALGGGWKEG